MKAMIGQPPKTGVKQSAVKAFLASRTKRERMMLLLLAVVAAAAFLMYALVIPALTKINDLADEVALLEEKKAQYHNAITQSDAQQKRYLDAVAAYDRAQGTYARPMTPESLDETITRLLLEADFEMETLSITPLSSEATPPFSPEPLEDNPLAAAGADDATADDASGRDAALEDASAFVYTANVSAAGTIQGLCTLLDRVADMPGVRIASYSYGGSGAARSEKERMQLVFKVYVLVEDDAQTDSGESAADAAG